MFINITLIQEYKITESKIFIRVSDIIRVIKDEEGTYIVYKPEGEELSNIPVKETYEDIIKAIKDSYKIPYQFGVQDTLPRISEFIKNQPQFHPAT